MKEKVFNAMLNHRGIRCAAEKSNNKKESHLSRD